jgi:hypothetical protein
METQTQTQKEAILRHLQSGKTITPLEALNLYGCYRLGARIWDLRNEGYVIRSESVKQGKKTFSSYKLNSKESPRVSTVGECQKLIIPVHAEQLALSF